MTIQEALTIIVMEPVIGMRRMERVCADCSIDWVTIELGMPQEHEVGRSKPFWTCSVRINIFARVFNAPGESSLDAIINATYLAARLLKAHPHGEAIDLSLLPNFGLPVSPVTTTPEALETEQNRPKMLRPFTQKEPSTAGNSLVPAD